MKLIEDIKCLKKGDIIKLVITQQDLHRVMESSYICKLTVDSSYYYWQSTSRKNSKCLLILAVIEDHLGYEVGWHTFFVYTDKVYLLEEDEAMVEVI